MGFRSSSIFEDCLASSLKEFIEAGVAEIFNKEFKQQLKAKIRSVASEEKLFFATEAAISEFMDRLKAPIQGDLIQIRFGRDEEDDE